MTRIERVAELIKKEISGIIREDVSDPRIGFVSITRVDVSSDLENAKVFISILGGENVKRNRCTACNLPPILSGENLAICWKCASCRR